MSQFVSSLQSFFKPREVLVVGIVLLLILGSLSLFSLVKMTDFVAANVEGTAAVQMKAISTAYVATSSVPNATTTTVQARNTAAAEASATATALVTDATAMAIASGNPYPPHNGTLALDDTLHNNSANSWVVASDKGMACQFVGGAYHAKTPKTNVTHSCLAYATNFSNFVYQVQVTILSGDQGGITFRINPEGHNYTFLIGSDGSYAFYKFSTYQATPAFLYGTSAAIKTGLKQTNLIAVIARGKTLDLYVNNQRINGLSDSAFSQGFIGVCATTRTGTSEVAYTNAKVWTL